MRERKWILYLTLATVVTVFGIYLAWRATEANDRIRKLILAKIRPYMSESTDIARLEVGLGRIRMHGVVIGARDSSYVLTIEHAEIGYSLWNLIKNKFVPYKASSEAVFVKPSLLLRSFGRPVPGDSTDSRPNINMSNFSEIFGNIRRVTVAKAQISLEGPDGKTIMLAHELNGWLHNPSADSASIRLAGNVFNSTRRNINLIGVMDVSTGLVDRLDAGIDDSKLVFDLPLLLPDYIEAVNGKIKGRFSYRRATGSSAEIIISEGVLAMKNSNILFEDVLLTGNFLNDDLDIQIDVHSFNGVPFRVDGRINQIFNPVADLNLSFPRFNLRRFLKRTLPEKRLPLDGQMSATFDITGSLYQPDITGTLLSKDFIFSGIAFDGFMAELYYHDLALRVAGEGKHANGLNLQLSTDASMRDSLFVHDAVFRLSGDARPLLGDALPVLLSLPSIVELHISGGLNSFEATGGGQIVADFENRERLTLQPRIIYKNEIMNFDLMSGSTSYISGAVSGLLTNTPEGDFVLQHAEDLFGPFVGADMATRLENIDISGGLTGTMQEWLLRGKGIGFSDYGERVLADLELAAQLDNGGRYTWDLNGNYFSENGNILDFLSHGYREDNVVTVESVSIGEIAEFKGVFPLINGSPRQGRLKFTDFRLEDLHEFFPSLSVTSGRVTGGAEWSEREGSRITEFEVNLQNGAFHGSKPYDADVMYKRINSQFVEAGLNLYQSGKQVLLGRLDSRLNDVLRGNISGSGIDYGDIIQAVTGDTVFHGTGNFYADITQDSSRTTSLITLGIPAGSIRRIPFTELMIEAADTTFPGQTWPMGTVSVIKSKIDMGDSLKVIAWGDLNHGGTKKSDISLLAQGDLLGLLPWVTPAITKSTGIGELFVRFASGGSGLVPGSGRIKVQNGEIQFSDIIGDIKDVNVDIVLPALSRTLDVSNVSGRVDKGTFTISNSITGTLPSGIEPLILPALSVDLGVLGLETSEKGIKLHIPGLMESGDKGLISFSGLEENTPFLISGPSSTPRLRGTLMLEDARITYPFLIEEANGDAGKDFSFIGNIEWDLNILPRKDVYFTRQIKNPLGNIYIDLQLRDNLGGLRIAGSAERGGVEVWGSLISTAGTIEAIDHLFRPERIVFEYPKGTADPIFSGRAFTTVIDTLGTPATVWLEITSINDDTGREQASGPWSKVIFKLHTDNPNLARTDADLMSALGYSESQLKERAYSALGLQFENLFVRPLLRPLEKGLRRHLGLDVVRFSSMFSRNLVQMQNYNSGRWSPAYLFLRSRLTVGKYLASGLYMTYTGQIQSNNPYLYHTAGIGFRHALVLEYSIRPDLFLEMEYTYDTQLLAERREDKRIWLRHIFPF